MESGPVAPWSKIATMGALRSLAGGACVVVAAVSGASVAGCGAGRMGQAVRPADPTAWQVSGDQDGCRIVSDRGEPLVVDWPAHKRGDLEEAMNDGVAVVAYDCHSLRLLKGCRIGSATYDFMPFSKKQQTIRFENGDEVAANLPSFGIPLLQSLHGELQDDSTLDLSMILIGKKRTTVSEAKPESLVGGTACEGATHFVRGVFVGAFAMGTGTKGRDSVGAALFSASSASTKLADYRDGDPASCQQVPVGGAPPDSCDALVRLELVALGATGASDDAATAENTCPRGLVRAEGKCTAPKAEQAHQCTAGDASDCAAQCAKHDAASCNSLGLIYLRGTGVAEDDSRAFAAFKQSCDGGNMPGCVNLGVLYTRGTGVAKDEVRAAALFQQGCDAGEAISCGNLANKYYFGLGVQADQNRAVILYRQACDGGSADACGDLGIMYRKGLAVRSDMVMAAQLFRKSCQGSVSKGCANLGLMYEAGTGVAADLPTAIGLYRWVCEGGEAFGCDQLKRLGQPLPSGTSASALAPPALPAPGPSRTPSP